VNSGDCGTNGEGFDRGKVGSRDSLECGDVNNSFTFTTRGSRMSQRSGKKSPIIYPKQLRGKRNCRRGRNNSGFRELMLRCDIHQTGGCRRSGGKGIMQGSDGVRKFAKIVDRGRTRKRLMKWEGLWR